MSIVLRSLLIVFSIMTVFAVIGKIRRAKMQIEDALFWVIFSMMLVVLSVYPKVVYRLTEITGMQSPSNLIFLVIIFVLILKIFQMSIKISLLESKIVHLVQNHALNEEKQNRRQTEEKDGAENGVY